jgi:3-hydroxymyristoyl/3-hydroxydecanoyl-(acyl carrier protein) dehydratase
MKCARTFTVPVDHPAFAGHFPGMPVLPGAALLDEALHVLEEELGLDLVEWQLTTAKFLESVRPGDALTVEHSANADVIRFALHVAKPHVADRAALAGTLSRLHAAVPHEL